MDHTPGYRILTIAVFFAAPLIASRADDGSHDVATLSDNKVEQRYLADEKYLPAAGPDGSCDVYLPQASVSATIRPVVLVIHGGAWVSGNKWMVARFAKAIADQGMVAIAINYRLAPQYKFPTQVDDVREALLWTKQNAQRFSIDLNRVGIFGYSAGGHLSTLIGGLANESIDIRASASRWSVDDPRWKELPKVKAVAAGGPPVDFRATPLDSMLFSFFLGDSRRQRPDVYDAASSAHHVSPGDPATQIIHGESDILVPIAASQRFHQAQLDAGIDSRFKVLPKQGHLMTFLNPETCETVVGFFEEVFAESEAAAPSTGTRRRWSP